MKPPSLIAKLFGQTPSGPERRRTSRFRARAPSCDLGTIADLSASGVRLRCRRHYKPAVGSRVSLSVTTEDGRGVAVPCIVCWVRHVGGALEAGLEFVSPDMHDLRRLAEIVNRADPQSPASEDTSRDARRQAG